MTQADEEGGWSFVGLNTCQKSREGLFTKEYSDRTRVDGFKLTEERFATLGPRVDSVIASQESCMA